MSAKLWAGRFSKDTSKSVNDYNSSIAFDCRMYEQDIRGSLAHAAMLQRAGILSDTEVAAISEGLQSILADLTTGQLEFDSEAEDIHMFIEAELSERIGTPGKKLHTARSRNDQVATDLRLYLRDEAEEIKQLLVNLTSVLLELAELHTETIMPGYTHMQRAQPITLAHHLLAYVEMFLRDLGRLADWRARMNYNPLGAGALATSTYAVDRFYTTELLGFTAPCRNSLDAVSDRDYAIELGFGLSMVMMHLSRLSEEIILWSSQEFRFIELDDAYATGSSMMPQKKNPDVAELTRGKTSRVFGSLMTLLTMMKNLPLAYNKDMQEDKEAVFDAVDTIKLCLPAFTGMMETLTVKKDRMRAAAAGGFTNATDLADYFVRKGLPFRDAHHVAGELVHFAIAQNCSLEALSLEQYRGFFPGTEADIYEAISLEKCVAAREVFGGPAADRTSEAATACRHELANFM